MTAFSIKFDAAQLEAMLDEMGVTMRQQARPSAQAGAQVLYDEVLLRVPVAATERATKSGRMIAPGALKASIYQVFSADHSGDGFATYHISWNRKKAPHGHLVEFGTSRAPAHPFLRPSYDARINAALQAARSALVTGAKAENPTLR